MLVGLVQRKQKTKQNSQMVKWKRYKQWEKQECISEYAFWCDFDFQYSILCRCIDVYMLCLCDAKS